MRLLHTKNLTFKFFQGGKIPQYAILSHRWSRAEVSHQEYQTKTSASGTGYAKIVELCKLARSRGLEWAWIDTCCIDKTSSAELTESINSMWSYYRNAAECYAYLADVTDWDGTSSGMRMTVSNGFDEPLHPRTLATLRGSEWFTRGWTLQELIAPTELLFCASDWRILGTKANLAQQLSTITGIDPGYLTEPDSVTAASIAMRMSWASSRQTTRVEDMAYCLLGLFDVNMPMLYGEGMKAFMRLQKKIIKRSDDESIFAWKDTRKLSGMLASSPAAFARSGDVVALNISPEQRLQYHLTNKGLELKIPSSLFGAQDDPSEPSTKSIVKRTVRSIIKYVRRWTVIPNDKIGKRVQLACSSRHPTDRPEKNVIGITLSRTEQGWKRVDCHRLDTWPEFFKKHEFSRSLYYVPQEGL